jgi:glycosyltransferase 2 family protein
MREALFSRALRLQVVGSGLLVQIFSVVLFFVLGRSVGVPLSFLDCLLLVPPALLLSALPVSLSGWGVREGTLAGMFALVGMAPADIVVVSILYGLTGPAIGVVYAVLSLLRR